MSEGAIRREFGWHRRGPISRPEKNLILRRHCASGSKSLDTKEEAGEAVCRDLPFPAHPQFGLACCPFAHWEEFEWLGKPTAQRMPFRPVASAHPTALHVGLSRARRRRPLAWRSSGCICGGSQHLRIVYMIPSHGIFQSKQRPGGPCWFRVLVPATGGLFTFHMGLSAVVDQQEQ
jgi:hypothetical protein